MAEPEVEIERRIDREVAGAVALASHPGGALTIAPSNMSELMEFAKLMAVSGPCIRAAFRGNPGACLALTLQAFKWGADPFAVANKAYIVQNKGGETQIAYEAQLIHAIVNTRARLKQPLRPEYSGQGVDRACKITGWIEGRDRPDEYASPPIRQIAVKNSPLWAADPDQQLFYYASRAWARRHVPEVLLGIYAPEDFTDAKVIEAEPMRPSTAARQDAWRDDDRPLTGNEALRERLAQKSPQEREDAPPLPEYAETKTPAPAGNVEAEEPDSEHDAPDRSRQGIPEALPPAEGASIEPIAVPRLKSDRGWDWPGYADALIAEGSRLPRDQVQAFRVRNANQIQNLRIKNKDEWSRVQQALAEHEREG